MRAKDHPNNAPGVPMIFPPWFENLQVKYLNRMVRPLSRVMPGMARIQHRGRKSGKPYETIVTAYRSGDTVAIVLGHGKTDWVKNVLAAGQAELKLVRRTLQLTNPRIVPAGGDAAGLPFMARVQAQRAGVFVADIARAATG
jgi:deazaflavin-dependent oxidoreductase (nitroreductase family)